jgi:hypothetical protein
MKRIVLVVAVALMIGFSTLASAQALNSGAQTINLNATLAESLTLSLDANAVNFTLAAGSATNNGTATITATTKWVLKPGRTAVGLFAYFSSTSALTGTGGSVIPSSAFQISDNSGAYNALTATTVFNASNSGLQLRNTAITGTNKNATVTDAMKFNIDLSTGTLPQLPADTYTGTLNIQAQATP